MKRIEIVSFLKDRKKIVERLQRRGIVEFTDSGDDVLGKMNTASYVSQFERGVSTATQAIEILEEYAPSKKSLLSALNGRREIKKKDFAGQVEQRDVYLQYCHDLVNWHKTIIDNKAMVIRTQLLMDALMIWNALDIPMQFKGTKHTCCFIGIIPKKKTAEEILFEIATMDPELEMMDVEVVSSYKEQTCVVIVAHKEIADRTMDVLRQIGFTTPSDPSHVIPGEKLRQYENDINTYQSAIDKSIHSISSYADKRSDIEFLSDYFAMRKEKYMALGRIGLTRNVFVISGFIPEKYAKKCVEELEARFTVAISIESPDAEEEVPVLLENNGFVSPVESITEMYALPAPKDIDPTPVLAFFYYLFFGMMLSDAGYGVLMVLGTGFVLWKFNVEGPMRKTLKMFFFCGISTVFWGTLFGSWFGDIVPIVCREFLHVTPPRMALWFDPISDPMKLLLFSFGLGIIHLFTGLAVHFKILWDEGSRKDALMDTVPTFLLVLGAAPLGAGILVSGIPELVTGIGKYMALSGMILIILTAGRTSKNIFARLGGGLYGFYNIASGYLSDILSYSRLLALGLATGSIAGVINLMGTMSENAVAKAVILAIVFVIAHPLNMAINLLGAYVHSNRLQFVELFSKFYEGGGRAFNPLKVDTKYIKFKEDNSNG